MVFLCLIKADAEADNAGYPAVCAILSQGGGELDESVSGEQLVARGNFILIAARQEPTSHSV